jgi:hypothetical protein
MTKPVFINVLGYANLNYGYHLIRMDLVERCQLAFNHEGEVVFQIYYTPDTTIELDLKADFGQLNKFRALMIKEDITVKQHELPEGHPYYRSLGS